MDSVLSSSSICHVSQNHDSCGFGISWRTGIRRNRWHRVKLSLMNTSRTRIYHRKPPNNLLHPRRPVAPPKFEDNTDMEKITRPFDDPTDSDCFEVDDEIDIMDSGLETDDNEEGEQIEEVVEEDDLAWDEGEIEAISSLFKGRIPQKPGKLARERPLPLPLPFKHRPLGLPSPKKRLRKDSQQRSSADRVYKDPTFLTGLAKEIKNLPPQEDVSVVLDKWAQYLRKGSLSLTVRELGLIGCPEKSLQIFCWVQKQPHLFPDDRLLASTVEILATNRELKMPFEWKQFLNLSSQSVYEAVVTGFIRCGNLELAYKLFEIAKNAGRILGSGTYAKFIYQLGKNPDYHILVSTLLDELLKREDLSLKQQDCTAVMKVCIRLERFQTVECLFNWFKDSGREPSLVMYTTLIHSRYSNKCYREAQAVIWELEAAHCVFDLPAYRVIIKLFVALSDLSRTVRYFSKLKEAGFSPTFDIYRDVFKVYAFHGRLAKCKEVCKEAEMAGFKLDEQVLIMVLDR